MIEASWEKNRLLANSTAQAGRSLRRADKTAIAESVALQWKPEHGNGNLSMAMKLRLPLAG
ncbi:MAG: hypothetical protein ACXIVG_03295 [Pararhodobacter sp.]